MRLKLIVQFSLVSSIVLLFTSALFTYFNLETLKKTLLGLYIERADSLSETIIRATHHEMLRNDRSRLMAMIQEVSAHGEIRRIRLINKDGIITYSSDVQEIENLVDKADEPGCRTCHLAGKTLTHATSMDLSRILKDKEGRESLGIIKPIYNEEACSSAPCHVHPEDLHLLGVLDLSVSTDEMNAQINDYRNNILVQILFLVLSISLCLTLLTQKLVNRPVKLLLEHTRAVARGDWRLIDTTPGDEIGELAEAFNEMTRKLKKAREDREGWAATLETRVEERTRELKEMQSVLIRSEKLASLGELVAGIAHELNNPLTGIMIHAPMIASDSRLDEDLREDCQTIIREAKRCSKIVGDLLDFSRVSDPHKTMSSINSVIDRTLTLVEHHPDFHDIEIVREYDEEIPEVLIDAGQIEQVLVNMLVNASQAMPDGGRLTIRTLNLPEEHSILIQLSDTGIGIPEKDQEKLFDPFFTTKGPKGTGLGLSVSYGIIESHGGIIEVDSRVGEGTTFSITLPITTPVISDLYED